MAAAAVVRRENLDFMVLVAGDVLIAVCEIVQRPNENEASREGLRGWQVREGMLITKTE